MTLDNAWQKLERYFDMMMHDDKISAERKHFKYDYVGKKIYYFGTDYTLAKMLVNKKFLVIDKY